MNRDDDRHHETENLGPDEQSALDALRAAPRRQASADLRARTRAIFLEGSAPVRRAPAPRRRRGVLVAAAVVAAMFVLFFYGSTPRSPWVIVDIHMAHDVLVNGEEPLVGARVDRGSIRTTPCSEVELAFEDRLHLRFLSDASADLPETPGRWIGHDRTLRVTQGEVYGTTRGSALDFRLHLQTDEATALLTGTTFAVIRREDATCFCLYSGSIEFTPAGADQPVQLPAGKRVSVFKDGREPLFEPLTDMERTKLQMLHDGTPPEPAPKH